jgi:hypothetical protein
MVVVSVTSAMVASIATCRCGRSTQQRDGNTCCDVKNQ